MLSLPLECTFNNHSPSIWSGIISFERFFNAAQMDCRKLVTSPTTPTPTLSHAHVHRCYICMQCLVTTSHPDLLGTSCLDSVHFHCLWPRSTRYAVSHPLFEFGWRSGRSPQIVIQWPVVFCVMPVTNYWIHTLSIDSQGKGGHLGICVLFWVKY